MRIPRFFHILKSCTKNLTVGLLNALSRIAPYMDFNKKWILVNAFFMSQFSHCPLTWMCHNRTKNNEINRIHEDAIA